MRVIGVNNGVMGMNNGLGKVVIGVNIGVIGMNNGLGKAVIGVNNGVTGIYNCAWMRVIGVTHGELVWAEYANHPKSICMRGRRGGRVMRYDTANPRRLLYRHGHS
ncbi:hypothetical protein BGX38DRAFT_1277234 [Terfezia claveryi]|nr:hypothetical protein BGX38DRAFT_1277234 [Terfezia claveryi]